MGVPTLKLDLAPPSTPWRLHHGVIGWGALAGGALLLAVSLTMTFRAHRLASKAGQLAGARTAQTRQAEEAQQRVLEELRAVDVAKELPRWRLAERIFTERSLPWSRLTAELERSMVPDVRYKSLQRTRGADMKVQVKIKGEARSRDAEADLMASLQKNPCFDQIILEREGERNGGGVDFEFTLAAAPVPPPYAPLPKYGPQRKADKPVPAAARPAQARPAPQAPARPAPVAPAVPARPQPAPAPQAQAPAPQPSQPQLAPGTVFGPTNPHPLLAPRRQPRPRPATREGDQ
ncbi:PilN domain-containing protein [Mesoterricola sediminis]|uniref:PilN domain-containing protein n=1 Tax=Mesoterricola sediminis TaxID=2927980 RepID=A0AA48KFQ0_9BACT|nr:PilN domain-containing protein [Mesoterricola sediminis]BDU76673.1 hypothetical protein METESE_16310 [Mesoterricola sediminis]